MTDVAVSYGKSFLGVFCWAWPRSSCCFVALETKRKSGWGICGSSLFVFLRFCVMICPFTGTGQLSCVPPFSPLMSLSGPCHRAFTAKLEEKKKIDVDWSYHEDWVQLQAFAKDVPSGFVPIKLDQIMRADKELWTILAQQQMKSLRSVNDQPVLNEDFKKLTTITMLMLPLPTTSARLQTQAPRTRAEKNCPEELKKYNLRLKGKGNICWNYNLAAGCSNSASGTPAKCMRGFHVCAHCHKPGHSVTACRSKTS